MYSLWKKFFCFSIYKTARIWHIVETNNDILMGVFYSPITNAITIVDMIVILLYW